jgi:hypothetical protein
MGKRRRGSGHKAKPSRDRRTTQRRHISEPGDRALPAPEPPAQHQEPQQESMPPLVNVRLELTRILREIEKLPEPYRSAARLLPGEEFLFLWLPVLRRGAIHPQFTPGEREECRQELKRLWRRLGKQLFPGGHPKTELEDEWLRTWVKNWYARLHPIVKALRQQRDLPEARRARLMDSVKAITDTPLPVPDGVLEDVLTNTDYSTRDAILAMLAAIVGKRSRSRLRDDIFRRKVSETPPVILTNMKEGLALRRARSRLNP